MEFKYFDKSPEVISAGDKLARLSALPPRELREQLSAQSSQDNNTIFNASLAEIMDTQLQSQTIDRAYEAAIIERNVPRAVNMIKATGWYTDFPETNPSFLTWISDRAREITAATMEQLKLLHELKKFIENYPLESIQLEFSFTPKLMLLFKRDANS